jgi:preprotein translocase subunit SecB
MAPLQLDSYAFSKLCVEVNREHKPNAVALKVALNIQGGFGIIEQDETKRLLTLKISELRPAEGEDGTLPYTIELEVIGQFSILDPQYQDKEKLVRVNGTSILYSAAREQILTITGRCLFGPYQLPTVNFQELTVTGPGISDELQV